MLLDYGILSKELNARFGDRFVFVPRVAPDKVVTLLHEADVVVGQLGIGALCLSELQAMSCAKPVITSFRYPYAYPEPPPLLEAPDADAVDTQLECLFRSPDYGRAVGEKAREWVLQNHDQHVLAERLEALYGKILSRARPHR